MLISLSEALETPVSTLLGETVIEAAAEDLKAISEKLEVINLQLARRKAMQRKALHGLFIIMCASIVIIFAVLTVLESPYLGWNFRATPRNSVRRLSQDFCSNSKFEKWRNTVCISHFSN